jgi:hypothetical protein
MLLKAFLSPLGRRRKFLVLCAYGAFNYVARFGLPAEQDRLEEELARAGAAAGGHELEDLITAARDRHAFLAEQLPTLAPDDLCLVGSRPLFDEFEEKMAEKGPKILGAAMPGDAPVKARWQLAALSPILVPDFELADTPEHTAGRDRDDDVIIETAFRGDACAIVSDDRRHIARDEAGTSYTHSGATVVGYPFETFVDEFVNSLHFDLEDVDPALSSVALEP